MWHVRETVLALIFVVVVTPAFVVRVHLRKGLFVEHAAADRFVHDGRAPGLVVDVVGLRRIVRPEPVLHELLAAFGQIQVGLRSLGDEFDVQLLEFLGVFELVDTDRGVGVLEGFAAGFDDLHCDFEGGGAPAALLVALGHFAADQAGAIAVAEADLLVDTEVQVQLVERDFLLALQFLLVFKLRAEFLEQKRHQLLKAFHLRVLALQLRVLFLR